MSPIRQRAHAWRKANLDHEVDSASGCFILEQKLTELLEDITLEVSKAAYAEGVMATREEVRKYGLRDDSIESLLKRWAP